jgi:peroxiredoxin
VAVKLLFVVPVVVAAIVAGGLLVARNGKPASDDFGIDFGAPRHLVTRQMEIETAAMKNRRPPELATTSELGKPIVIAHEGAERPQFVLFIKDGCPCSIDAQPLFNELARKFQGHIDFVGVIDGDREHALKYAEQYSAAFPVAPDGNLGIARAFGAKGGLYSALIARNGHIVKMWPGYSADILKEMNGLFCEESALKTSPFDPKYAPKQEAAGCAYTGNW